ncbi:excalibur calcium-binding domain-containing protein [Sporosarcina sp. P20a]|uniref:excalibur calcium-binding domain-containing protein n=1 Tax=Sporosarcina sp. P20a TaxID=2048256 RepID=UPI001E405A8B|nr:excalibur calcium-binding domain-containing protein [Sporosarcina sp. P20a]
MAGLLVCSVFLLPVHPADAAAVKFKNCMQLNKSYAGGVAMNAIVKNKGGKTKYKPTVAASIYITHKGLNRNKDGIACER